MRKGRGLDSARTPSGVEQYEQIEQENARAAPQRSIPFQGKGLMKDHNLSQYT